MIKASYEEMNAAANEITGAANKYQANVDALYNTVSNLETSWKGPDNLTYVETVNSYKENLKALGDVINNYSIFLNKSADYLRETQDEVQSDSGRL